LIESHHFLVKLSSTSVWEDLDAILLSSRSAVRIFQPILQLSKKWSWPSLRLRFLYLHASDVGYTNTRSEWRPWLPKKVYKTCGRVFCSTLERLVDLHNW